jgi:hypothetical protein
MYAVLAAGATVVIRASFMRFSENNAEEPRDRCGKCPRRGRGACLSEAAERPAPTGSPPLATSRFQGEDERNRSRGAASRPSYAGTKRANKKPGVIFVRWRRWWDRRHHDQARISDAFPGQDAPRQRRIADPGPSQTQSYRKQTQSYRRSRFCSASLRAALRPGNNEKKESGTPKGAVP